MHAPARREPGDAAARFVGGLSCDRDEEPASKVTGWDRAARADVVWGLKWGCFWVCAATVTSGALVVGFLIWAAMNVGRQIAEGIGESLQASVRPFVEELRAADVLASVPAPPPEVGTAEQAAALGPAMADALNAGDRAAAIRLLNAPSLLRGLIGPELAEQFAAALADGEVDAQSINPRFLVTYMLAGEGIEADPKDAGPASDDSGERLDLPPPEPPAWAGEGVEALAPGESAVLYFAMLWSGIMNAAEPSTGPSPLIGGAEFDGVTTHDGVPAAALLLTQPGEDPDPCDGIAEVGPPVKRRVLLIPAPDGRVGCMFFVGTQADMEGFPAPEGGETFEAAFRRSGRSVLAPMLENFKDWPGNAGSAADPGTDPAPIAPAAGGGDGDWPGG